MSDANDTTAPLEPAREPVPTHVAPPIAGAAAPEAAAVPPAYAGQPGVAYQPAPAPDHKHRDRVVAIIIAAVLGVFLLAGTFACGVGVGSHLGRGRTAFGPGGAMMGQGYSRGLGGQQGQGLGGRGGRGMRGGGQFQQNQQLPQNQLPQGQTGMIEVAVPHA